MKSPKPDTWRIDPGRTRGSLGREGPGIRSLLLLVLFISPLFMSITASSVWDANEAFYAQTPREMVDSGDWLIPEFNGSPRLNKPPLSYWLVALCYKVLGVSILWERLLMAALGAVSVFSTFQIGKILYSLEAGLLGAGIFATTFRFLIVSRRLMIDSLVLCAVLVGIALFLYWMRSGRNRYCLASAFVFGLAFLAKGPVGLFPFLFLGIYCLLPQNRWCLAAIPWIPSGILFLATASSWFLAVGFFHGWDPVISFFMSENLGRFANEEFGPRRGYTYYFGVFMGDYLPWSIPFLGLLLHRIFRGEKPLTERKTYFSSETLPNGSLLMAAWIATYLLIFSLSYNKQEYYILPAYPAASILLGAAFSTGKKIGRWTLPLAGILMLGLFPLVWFISEELFPGAPITWWLPAGAALLAGACLLKREILLAALSMVFFYQAVFFTFSGPLEDYKPVAPLAEIIKTRASTPNFQAGYYLFTAPSLRFYMDRDIHEIYDLEKATRLLRNKDEAFLITSAAGKEELRSRLGERLFIVAEKRKFSSRLRVLIERFRNRSSREDAWSRPVFLVSNRDHEGGIPPEKSTEK